MSFDDRSSGFVWFFSFLVWFSQLRKHYGDNLVVLLDEPGLSLHARAQSDLLRYIKERLVPNYQVIYTTHSPFLVDVDELLGVRTVEDVVVDDQPKGTKVGDKVLSTDADTLFPLQGALGYDITQTLFVGKNTLLVEGPSDFLYIRWLSKHLQSQGRVGLDRRWTVAPVGGLSKISSFVTLFRGTQLNVAALIDVQRGQKQKTRDLLESELLKKGHILLTSTYAGQDEADIEDMLGRELYCCIVNQCYGLTGKKALPAAKPKGAPFRVLEEVEDHLRLIPELPEFDHYTPAQFFIENAGGLAEGPSFADAAARFERLFGDLNEML